MLLILSYYSFVSFLQQEKKLSGGDKLNKDVDKNSINSKKINRYRILKYIYENKSTSQVILSKSLGLSESTISRNIRPYIDNLLVHTGKSFSTGGRKANLFSFNYSYKNILSIQIDRDFLRASIGELDGRIIEYYDKKVDNYNFDEFKVELHNVLKYFNSYKDKITAIVFGISGYVLPNGNFYVSILDWNNIKSIDLVNVVKQYFNKSIIAFENDANLLALRELHDPSQTGNHILCLYWERGLGMGLILDRKLYIGRGASGEIGQCVFTSKKLEDYLESILRSEKIVWEITKVLRNLFLLFDPDLIVLNGKFEKFFKDIHKIWTNEFSNPCKLIVSSGGDKAILEGGIYYGAELYLRNLTTGFKSNGKVWR